MGYGSGSWYESPQPLYALEATGRDIIRLQLSYIRELVSLCPQHFWVPENRV